MGRDLTGYSRDWLPPNIYFDTSPASFGPWIDLPGFSSGVESYEYSKQPMNNLAFESGAGAVARLRPAAQPDGGDAARVGVRDRCGRRVQQLGAESYAHPVELTSTPTATRRPTRSAGRASGRRTSPSSVRSDDRADELASPSRARSPPTTIPAPPARSSATTTSATRRRCTCPTAPRRSTAPSRPAQRLGGLEVRAVDPELPADHARRRRGGRHRSVAAARSRAASASPATRSSATTIPERDASAPTSARATSRASRRG